MCGSITKKSGQGTPILFVHEFAGDHRSWEPQLREFGKRYRCIAYAARGYTPSDVPPDPDAYSYKHVMRDAVAVLDHLKIDKAHIVGLSMGGYTTLQVALNHPKRVRSMTLAGTGSGSERWYTEAFHKNSRDLARCSSAKARPRWPKTYGNGPSRIPFVVKDARGFAEFAKHLAEHDAQGSAHTSRGFQGARPSLYDFEDDIRKLKTPALIVVGDEDDRCIEPSLFLKATIAGFRPGHVPEDRPCGEPGGAGSVQPGGRRFSRPRRRRALGCARSARRFRPRSERHWNRAAANAI